MKRWSLLVILSVLLFATVIPVSAAGYGPRSSVFTFVGNINAMMQGFQMLDKRGLLVVVGLPKVTDVLAIPPFALLDGEKMVTGGYMGSTNLQRDIPELVALYKGGKLKLDELVTAHYTLDQINEAIESVEQGKALRNVIMFK